MLESLHAVIAMLPTPVVVVDRGLRVLAASNEFLGLMSGKVPTGIELGEILYVQRNVYEQIRDAIAEDRKLTLVGVRAVGDEQAFDIGVAPWRLPDGQSAGVMITLTEVTKLASYKQVLELANEELESQRQQAVARGLALQSILEAMDVGVVVVDAEGSASLWNRTASKYLGGGFLSGALAEWSEYYELLDEDHKPMPMEDWPLVRAHVDQSANRRTVCVRDKRRNNGRWLTISATPLKGVPGHQALAVFTDITEQRLIQQELEEFAYVASHDLQEPLRMVKSYVDLLDMEYSSQLGEEAKEYMHFAVDGAARMQALIRDLLVLSRTREESISKLPTPMGSVVATVLADLGDVIQSTHAEVTVDPLPTLSVDRDQMGRLFMNLLSNAIKFVPPGRVPNVRISALETDSGWRFAVQDNGIGMDSAYTAKAFKMFQRLNAQEEYPGTGIGLAVCKRIVQRHEGRIGADSALGEGSTFWFFLPKEER